MKRTFFGFAIALTFACIPLIGAFSILIGPSPGDDYAYNIRTPTDFSLAFLGVFTANPSDEIKLRAAIADAVPIDQPATLNRDLRAIEIRTALEDTSRLRLDLG